MADREGKPGEGDGLLPGDRQFAERTKMKRNLAQAIIDVWKLDGICAAVEGLKDYMANKPGSFFPIMRRVRVMLASKATLASNALWANNENAALAYLIKYGLKGNRRIKKPPKINETRIVSPRLSGKANSPKHDWRYVK